MGLGGPELIMIGVVVLLLFGGKKLPELMRGLGKGIKEFKNAKEGSLVEAEEPVIVNTPVSKQS
ncbi:MAG: twin-arginine translocase TatA/TatE family subunit [Bacteroidota bacterium]